MTVEEKLVKRILSVGSAGVKKTDLRKELGDVEEVLEKVISKGEVFVDKRAGAYYCFHKTHYIQSLLNSDPRFKLTYDMIQSLQVSVSSSNKELARTVETLVAAAQSAASSSNLQTWSVVVVEDEARKARLAEFLRDEGRQVESSVEHDGEEKSDLHRQKDPAARLAVRGVLTQRQRRDGRQNQDRQRDHHQDGEEG